MATNSNFNLLSRIEDKKNNIADGFKQIYAYVEAGCFFNKAQIDDFKKYIKEQRSIDCEAEKAQCVRTKLVMDEFIKIFDLNFALHKYEQQQQQLESKGAVKKSLKKKREEEQQAKLESAKKAALDYDPLAEDKDEQQPMAIDW